MQMQRLAGLGHAFPPIAKARWMGHPFVLGSVERTGSSNGNGCWVRVYVPPIANARWMVHPFVLGSLERTGNSNGKNGEDDEVSGLMDTT
jgi:hypothetical protein